MSLAVRVLTVFPALVESALSEGMARIARERGVLDLATVNIRDFTEDRHRTTDDTPFGGGAGMVMMVEPVVKAWRSLPTETRGKAYVMSAKGMLFTQELAEDWSRAGAMTLVCGRYKGVDERVVDMLGAEEVSLGDFVLPGGELAAAVMIEATARLLPGVLGDAESGAEDSHQDAILGYPDYTRPEDFEGHRVPEVLLSGHHANIAEWRRKQRLETTWRRRPDLLEKAVLSDRDREFLKQFRESQDGPSRTEGSGNQRKES
jgi:tRNA (guanine37-N1)-methyltransferase